MKVRICCALAAGLSLAQGTAIAQDAPKNPGDAASASYDAAGVRAGSFLVFPKVELTETFNSNIYATKNNAKSDFITGVSPSVTAKSDWSRHALNFTLGSDYYRYASHNAEDIFDFRAETDGKLDITRDTYLTAGLGYKRAHEDRSSPDDTGGKEPTEYNLTSGKLGGKHTFNRFSLGLDGTTDHYDFKDSATSTGTTNNDDRDRNEYTESVRGGYEFSPGYTGFIKGKLNQRTYSQARDDNGYDRDSTGYEVDGGVAFELSRVLSGDVYGGFMKQEYSDARFKSVSGPSAGVGLTWYATGLTTVRPTLTRTIEESTFSGASGYTSTTAGLGVSHELLRNVVLSANASYASNDYNGITRNEDILKLGGGAKYKLNRNFYVGGDYTYTDKDVDVADGYKQHKAMLTIGGQL